MILVLSGGGKEARQLAAHMTNEGIMHLCLFSSFADAGAYGKGNTFVGRLSEKDAEAFLRENQISGVADVTTDGHQNQSLAVMAACKVLGIPYVKYLQIEVPKQEPMEVEPSYAVIAKTINRDNTPVLFYARPETVRAIAAMVENQSLLYTPILRGIQFDVSLALEFGIPLIQVIENDGIDGKDAVLAALKKSGAKRIICDGTGQITDKLAVAKQKEIPMLLTHSMGVEYTQTVLTVEKTMELIRTWG